MSYRPGQARIIPRFLRDRVPKWLILGGPADGTEAQYLKAIYPDLETLCVEPLVEYCDWQRANGFPHPERIVNAALGVGTGETEITVTEDKRGSTQYRVRDGVRRRVPLTSVQTLDDRYGPFRDAVLWLDIEGAELDAVLGGTGILARRDVVIANVEVHPVTMADQASTISRIMGEVGMDRVDVWGSMGPDNENWVFLRRDR